MSDTPEFSRPVRIDTLGSAPRTVSIEADEAERAALARRFGFESVSQLAAEAEVVRKGEAIVARGTLTAALAQSCVATGEPVEETIEEPFEVEFRPHPNVAGPEEELEIGENELDVVFYDGAMIDVGELAAETLLLSVDPYPRAPGAEEALKEAGVQSEEDAAPLSPLAQALKDKLGK